MRQADFIRNGTAKGIMSMSKENSTQLWNSVQDSTCPIPLFRPVLGLPTDDMNVDDFNTFNRINKILLNPATPLRHIPLRVYIPSSPTASAELGSFKIVQTLVPPMTANREVQTLGSALNSILPSLFPSRRDAILAEPILHGAPVPFRAPLEEIMREAAYADGWIHLSISMIDA